MCYSEWDTRDHHWAHTMFSLLRVTSCARNWMVFLNKCRQKKKKRLDSTRVAKNDNRILVHFRKPLLLGILQTVSLNPVDPLVSVSNLNFNAITYQATGSAWQLHLLLDLLLPEWSMIRRSQLFLVTITIHASHASILAALVHSTLCRLHATK